MNTLVDLIGLLSGDLAPGALAPVEDSSSGIVQIFMLIVAGLVAIATWLFFLWGVKDKQFEEIEEVATRVVDLDKQDTTGASSKYQESLAAQEANLANASK